MIFFVFDKHKNNIVVLLTLDKPKKIFTNSETGCLSNPYFLLTDCLGIQFID